MTTWSINAWNKSISSKAYNPDWWGTLTPATEPELWAQLRAIYEEEMAIECIPDWAREIVVRMMELPMCGYYAFPANVNQIIAAIASEHCPEVVMRCYTVDPQRKTLMAYYVYCLDAWSKAAPLQLAITELSLRNHLGKNWANIVAGIYRVLGERTPIKKLVVDRLIHRLRWWIKTLIWQDDKRDRFMLDVYSGDIRGNEERFGAYGNTPYGDPYFTELQLPHIEVMESEIVAKIGDGRKLLDRIHSTWLCAPKVFRYLEKLIMEIGAIDNPKASMEECSLLQCEDTYPDFETNRQCFLDLSNHLALWLEGKHQQLPSLGATIPVKHWLVHLLWHKLLFLSRHEENFAKLMGMRPHGKSGTMRDSSATHFCDK